LAWQARGLALAMLMGCPVTIFRAKQLQETSQYAIMATPTQEFSRFADSAIVSVKEKESW